MSKAFVERFKGRMELVNKTGINGLVSSAQNPIAKQPLSNYQPANEMNEDLKVDERKFSKNAQTNILDFNRNYQGIINENNRVPNQPMGSMPRSLESKYVPRVVQSSTDYNRMANSYGNQSYANPHVFRPSTHPSDYQQFSAPHYPAIPSHEYQGHPPIYSKTAYGQYAPPIDHQDYFYASTPMPGHSGDPMSNQYRQANNGPNGSQMSEQLNQKGYFSIHTNKQEQSKPKLKTSDKLLQKENFSFGGLGPNFSSDWLQK